MYVIKKRVRNGQLVCAQDACCVSRTKTSLTRKQKKSAPDRIITHDNGFPIAVIICYRINSISAATISIAQTQVYVGPFRGLTRKTLNLGCFHR